MYEYRTYRGVTYKKNHHSPWKRLSNQDDTARGTNGLTKTDAIAIDQELIENLVSAHHSIVLLLNLSDKNR